MTVLKKSIFCRICCHLLVGVLSLYWGLTTSHAWAQGSSATVPATYPAKTVTVLVPQAAGGTNDFVARVLAAKLAELTGQGFAVENKPGAGGNIGTQAAAKAPADGYTLLVTINSAMAINPALYKTPGFDPVRDFVPIGLVATVPNVLVVNSATPYGNLQAFINAARAAPNTLQYVSAGNGTLNHLLGEMLSLDTGIKMQHIPYKGVAPALNDILGGQVPRGFASLPSALPHIRSGKLRALGVSGARRSAAAPDIPAIGETVPGFGAELWVAVFAPKGTPVGVTRAVEAWLAKALDDKDLQARLAGQGAELGKPAYGNALASMLRSDLLKWDKIVKTSGAKID